MSAIESSIEHLDEWADSNVDVIVDAMTSTPEDHAWDCTEEMLYTMLGDERAATELATHDAFPATQFFDISVRLRWAFR